MKIFVQCPPGLEAVTAQELDTLGLRKARYMKGGYGGPLSFDGGVEAIYRANLWLRTGERVLVRLGQFPATSFAELEQGIRRLELPTGVTVRAECVKSKLYHQKAVAQRIENLAGKGDQLLFVRMEHDVCTVELDTSGEPLHRRGYRQETAKAPLRETLAAAMLLSSEWDGRAPLVDPFCGSGTIPIEAALIARKMAPGKDRRFAFMAWPQFDAALWKKLRDEGEGIKSEALILGSDRDAGAIEAAQGNAARAGVVVEWSRRAVSAVELPAAPGWLVTNPPYGHRVGAGDPRDVYAAFGKIVPEGWRVTLICPTMPLAHATGLPLRPGPTTMNGGLDVRLASL